MNEQSGMNRAKFYQLALFPMNNGATNVYFVLILSYIATEADVMYGASSIECGNYQNLSLAAAKEESARYLSHLRSREQTFRYAE